MRIRTLLAAGLPAVAGLALLSPAPAQATGGHPAAAPTCSYMCVWSGPNYTGTEAAVPRKFRTCISASSLGLDAIRSAVTPEYMPADFWSSASCGGTYVQLGGDMPQLNPPAGAIDIPLES
jgi:hypothetical protein